MNLREWQKEAYEFFKENNNSLYEIVTGGGKTYFAIYCIRELLKQNPNLKILIVGPKNVIIEQTWHDELHYNGFPINNVGLFNQSAKELSKITLCSIQSLGNLIKLGLYNLFDFVVFDEVHNYGTEKYLSYLRIPKQYKIGLSATLERQDLNDITIRNIFDWKIYNYDIKQGLNDEIINKFDFYHYSIELNEDNKIRYEELTKSINLIFKTSKTNNIDKIKDEQVKNKLYSLINERKDLIDNYPIKYSVVNTIIKQNLKSKIIVFNQYNQISKNIYWNLMDEDIDSEIVNSSISRYQQMKALKRFEEDESNILLATTMFDEGYNLPKIDVAILMSQNSTTKQFIQRMGRVLRKKEINSKVYYITVKDTYEEVNYNKKKDLIKEISNEFIEIDV